jgi:ornithine lipid ester-linked acyl 2-hydroxylase
MENRLWFSLYDFSFDYKGREPSFIEPESFAWAEDFAAHYVTIYKELRDYLEKSDLESYFNTSMVNTKNTWRTISLKNWDIELYKHQQHFPFTTNLIKKYPEILSMSFNLLEPNGKILPHCGDTNGIYRCHLGLDIPAGLPSCGFRVRDEIRPWENGKWLIFMDAYNHEAFNLTDKPRFILVLDILREEYKRERVKIFSTVRTSLFLQKRAENYPFLRKLSPKFIHFLGKMLTPAAYYSSRLVNLLKIY